MAVAWAVEALESRRLLSTVVWDGGPSGTGTSWSDPTNWAGDVKPLAGDDAVISTAGATILFTQNESIQSITSSRAISFNAGTLVLSGTADFSASPTVNGATIQGGTLNASGGATIQFSASTSSKLDGVIVNADLNLTQTNNSKVTIYNGLVLNGTLSLGNSAGSVAGQVSFGDATHAAGTLGGTGTVLFGGSTANAINNASSLVGPSGVLTLGSGLTIHGKSGSIVSNVSGHNLVNQAAITADVAGGSIVLENGNGVITNQAAIQVINGASVTITNLINQATATVSVTGSTLTLGGTLSNLGAITATNSTVNLAGTFTQADLGNFVRTGGTVNFSGVINGNFQLNANTGSWVIDGGTIQNGTFSSIDATTMQFGTTAATFRNLTWNGDIDMRLVANARLIILDTLTLNGTLYLGNASGSTFGNVVFGGGTPPANTPYVLGNATLNGNATVVFGGRGGSGNALVNNSVVQTSASDPLGFQVFQPNVGLIHLKGGDLTIGANVEITGGGAPFNGGAAEIRNNFSGGNIVNFGVIGPTSSGVAINVGTAGNVTVSTTFVRNHGTLHALNGGIVNVFGLVNDATVDVGAASSLTLSGSISNSGTITSTNGSVTLAANFVQSDLGTLNRTGGSINLAGTLNGGLNLNSVTGSWNLLGGTINGGTINESSGALLIFTNFGGTLSGVTVNGDMDLSQYANANARVLQGLVVHGNIYLGDLAGSTYGRLIFGSGSSQPGTLSGTGSVVFGGFGSGNYLRAESPSSGSQTLTLASGISIRGKAGSIHHANATGSIVLQGSLNADVGGGNLIVGDGNGTIINQGSIQVTNGNTLTLNDVQNRSGRSISAIGSTLALGGTWSNAGTLTSTNSTINFGGSFNRGLMGKFVRSGGTVNITGTLAGGFTLDAASGSWLLRGGTLAGGLIQTRDSAALVFTIFGGVLNTLTVNGTLDGAVQGGTASVHGGLVLNGTLLLGSAAGTGTLTFGSGTAVQPGTFAGNATVIFGDSNGTSLLTNSSALSGAAGTLTIAPSVLIRGKDGSIRSNVASATISLLGTVNADIAGGAIQIGNGIGNVNVLGALQASSGSLTSAGMTLDGQSTLGGTWSTGLSLTASLLGATTSATSSSLRGTLTFTGGTAGAPRLLEAMSRDLGITAAGFSKNFVIGKLSLVAGGYVKLVDQSDNSAGSEAVYANAVVVPGSTTLDLNGQHLYARSLQNNGTIINGTVTIYPDGGALELNNPLPGAITPVGSTDTWTFFGRAGQMITAYVNPGSGGNAPIPVAATLNWARAQLLDPSNTVIATASSSSSGAAVALSGITLPADGVYSIKINAEAAHSTSVGNYVVAAWDVTPHISSLQLSQKTVWSIRTPFGIDQWTFAASAGDQIQLDVLNKSSSGIVFTLTGPGGYTGFTNIAGDSPLVNLPADGIYTLSVQGLSGAVGDYSLIVEPTTQLSIPLNGVVNGTLAGSGQAKLYTVVVPSPQSLQVTLDDSTNSDINEVYIKRGSAPTRESYDYRYDVASSADHKVLVPRASAGTWYVLVYAKQVPAPSNFSLSANGFDLRLKAITPTTLGNSAPITMQVSGSGFQPGTTLKLIGPGATEYAATSTSVVSYAAINATFPAGIPAGVYSLRVTHNAHTDTLSNAFTITAGGTSHFESHLTVPSLLGRHAVATVYVTYGNSGTVAMPAPMLVLGSTDPLQRPLFTLDQSKLSTGLWTDKQPDGFSNTIQILASGKIAGVLLPGESIKIPVYYAGLQKPWDFNHTTVPLSLGVIRADNTKPANWASQKDDLRPEGVSEDAWDRIYSNLTQQLGNTWGQFVSALDANAAYLGAVGENVNDIGKLWSFMYHQANASLGPVTHLQTVFDASMSMPNGGALNFWRNYPASISGRNSTGILGRGWTVPYQSSLTFLPDGSVDLNSAGEPAETFLRDSRGKYFPTEDGLKLTADSGGTYTITGLNGQTDTYSAAGRLIRHSDLNSNNVDFTYNGGGQLTGLASSSGQSITIGYNGFGHISSLTTSDGNVATYNYDAANEYLTSVATVEGTFVYTYDPVTHSLASIRNLDGSHAFLTYDPRGRLQTLASERTSMTLSYPSLGQITATDGMNHIFSQYYNEDARVVKTVNGLGQPRYFSFDEDGNLSTLTNAIGDFFAYQYDDDGNLTRQTDPLGNSTVYTYADFGHLSSITDPKGNRTSYTYDSRGNPAAMIYADGSRDSFTFDAKGQPTVITHRDGKAVSFVYDADGNITKQSFADGTHYDFTYDVNGNMLTAADSGGVTTFGYDATGHMTGVAYPNGMSLTYAFNAAGKPTSVTDQTGYTINYQYDSAGRPWKLLDGNNAPITTYTYNAMSRVTRQDNANGTYVTVDYDALGNILHVTNFAPGGGINSKFDYTYNILNQATSMTTPDGTWTYSYDAAGQLTRAVFSSTNVNIANQDLAFSYDPNGNRTSTVINGVTTDYITDVMNQYTSIGGIARDYDSNGNLISDGTATYAYNPLNQLIGIDTGSSSTQFTINALGQRIASNIDGQVTQFLNAPSAFGDVFAQFNGAGALQRHFNYGLGGIVSQTTASGDSYFYDTDQIGSIVGLTNSSGAYANKYSYLPFGELLASTESVANPFKFVGGLGVTSDGMDLLHMGAREYSASTGVFTSRDPMQILAGSASFYTYAFNEPVQVVDPSGLDGMETGQEWIIADGKLVLVPLWGIDLDGRWGELRDGYDKYTGPLGPIWDTAKGILWDAVVDGKPITAARVGDAFADSVFGKLNVGPFLIGTIEQTLLQPDFAINVVDGINAVRRSGACGTINGYEAAALVEIGMASEGCEDAPGLVMPQAPADAADSAESGIAGAIDPNDKIGPHGYGAGGYVAGDANLPYKIDFENSSTATAPAQQVTITDQLSSNLDWSTFRLSEFGWGDIVVKVPEGLQEYQSTVSMTYNGKTFDVLVNAALNLVTGIFTMGFFSIDPATDLPPEVLTGFLPPEDGSGRGMGYVSYAIRAKAGLPSGTQIRNIAKISFDEQEIIATNQVDEHDPLQGTDPNAEALITIDNAAPSSFAWGLPPVSSKSTFMVIWSGQDDSNGSGIASVDVYVSDNGGAFTLWQEANTGTSAYFAGVNGHTYRFYSVARDYVGHLEAATGLSDVQTIVQDSVAPQLLGTAFPFAAAQNRIELNFDESVAQSLSTADFTLMNLTTGQAVPAGMLNVTFNNVTNKATITYAGDALPNGNYRLTLTPAGISDSAGNVLQQGATLDFFSLAGDINRDRKVDAVDLAALSANWQKTSRTFADGDLNYDGRVDNFDLLILSANYQVTLPIPASPISIPTPTPPVRTPVRTPARTPVAASSAATTASALAPVQQTDAAAATTPPQRSPFATRTAINGHLVDLFTL